MTMHGAKHKTTFYTCVSLMIIPCQH